MGQLYRKDDYHGRTLFTCLECPYNSFDEDKVDAHVERKHPDAITHSGGPVTASSVADSSEVSSSTTPPTSPAGGSSWPPRAQPETGGKEKGR